MRKKSNEPKTKVQYNLPEATLRDLKILALVNKTNQTEMIARIIDEAAAALPDIEERRKAFNTLFSE